MLDMLPLLPRELQSLLKAMPPELRAMLDNLPPADGSARPEIEPLLQEVVSVGLATEERTGPEDENPELFCHELVRERIRGWMAERPQDREGWTENAIRIAYAERLAGVFQALQHQNMTLALQAGSRAVVHFVQAEAWDRLGEFAGWVITSANDPRLLDALIPHLRTAAESAPEGRPRWSCLCNLADALWRGGRPDASMPFFQQAAVQARAAAEAGGEDAGQALSKLGWITGNWAHACLLSGDLDAARRRQLEAAEAKKQAGNPAVDVFGNELEALRIDIMHGQVETALPQIESRLARVADWRQRHRAGQQVPEAPDAETLARTFIGGLDIGVDADYARKDWESALGRLDTVLEVMNALQRPAEDIGMTRGNRANVLTNLGRFGEARSELEACLDLFQNNAAYRQKVLSSLADLFSRQGDQAQAVTQERRALALCEQLPDPADRAISHNNLANYLEAHGTPSELAESPRHQLAALIYCLVAGLGQDLQTSLHNYAIDFRRARAAGTPLVVPRVAELLADPAFHPLEQWLRARQIERTELQSAIDQFLAQAKQLAEQ